MNSRLVVLGLSGGVDSAVAACILKERGYEVSGLYLDIGRPGELDTAREVAESLGISFSSSDIRAELEEHVCKPFAEGYLRGETPNPCVMCNPSVKFPALYRHAEKLGAAYVATGHYARVIDGAIFKSPSENDQSYMLCRLTREQISGLILPLGDMAKTSVRRMAGERGLSVASKPDSMEICFIPDGDYGGFIELRGVFPPPGNFIEESGNTLGRHRGIHRYTLGQRRHLGVSAGRRLFVSEIRPETNEIVLSDGEGLFSCEVHAADFNWQTEKKPEHPLRADVRVRHSKAATPALVIPEGNSVRICFDSPVRAPSAGQYAAVYDGERLLGGGRIL